MKKYDSIIIGAGQAGPSLAASLAGKGEKVALIEKEWLGGTCVNTGCTPTKTMVASAKVAHMATRGDDYGVVIANPIKVDMKKVKARKDKIVEASREGLQNWLNSIENLTIYKAHARFVDSKTISIGPESIQGEKIFINVGGQPRILDDMEGVNFFTSNSIMDVDFLPEHLIIVGGSYIGLEFAQMFRRFGSEVTVIEQNSRLVRREDEEVSEEIKKILEKEGVKFRLNAQCIKARPAENNQVMVTVDCDRGEPEIKGSHLLLAIGRVPNTDDLGLENTDVALNERGYIKVNDQLETTVSGIWAMGDVNGQGAFTHTAYNDFEIIRDNLLNDDSRSVKDRISCYALFTDPPLARVGMTEKQAKDKGHKILVGKREMTRVSRAKEKGETQGFMKVLVNAENKTILGATILGVEGDEAIHSILDVMYAGSPYTVIQKAVHIHPTVSELIPTMLSELKPL